MSALIHQLSAFPTSVLSDTLDELGIPGVLPGLFAQRQGQGRAVGRALPVKLLAKKNDPDAYRFGGGVGKPLEAVLKTMADGDIVLMDLGGANYASAWGGLASRLAQRRGVRATIMWGTVRDVDEIREIGYPVWAVGVCPKRSRNDFTFGSINETIEIGGVSISREDYIVADESGVMVIPGARAKEIVEIATRIAAQEEELLAMVRTDSVKNWDEV
ncbi:4-hydroxy-4-methyl-2-oxoglutarate aldolase [Caballeronia calidae]|uniref:Putative 4-hydroxy-4-methyl-2-oxoglutarate aldolase n=1 Tax=Caballeronia calidae TaxID=1777139 RepID=A0A158EIS6_9BURK|nr:RraA family protein [Caballeronia calidae]SAL06792.1 4-hydroxy-4-methyl-2-oxoglutarate aldolase [Caballeronia calidae]